MWFRCLKQNEANASSALHLTHFQAKCCWTSGMAPQALEFKTSTFGLRSSELTNRGNLANARSKCRAVPIQCYERHESSPLLQLSNSCKTSSIADCKTPGRCHLLLPKFRLVQRCSTLHFALKNGNAKNQNLGKPLEVESGMLGSINMLKVKIAWMWANQNKPTKSPWNLSNAPACNSCTIQASAFSGLIS